MDQNGKDDLKTQFVTREGTYRLITLSEYSRPNRVGYQSNQNNPQVRVSLLPAKQITDATKSFNVGSTATATISTNTTATNSVIMIKCDRIFGADWLKSSVLCIVQTKIQINDLNLYEKVCVFFMEIHLFAFGTGILDSAEFVTNFFPFISIENIFYIFGPGYVEQCKVHSTSVLYNDDDDNVNSSCWNIDVKWHPGGCVRITATTTTAPAK